MSVAAAVSERPALVRRGLVLERLTLGYNLLEAAVALASGVLAGSIALIGFGIDSLIESSSALVLLWRLGGDHIESQRDDRERTALKAVGFCFAALAVYVSYEAVNSLRGREAPHESLVGIALAVGSLIVMPLLARAKRPRGLAD